MKGKLRDVDELGTVLATSGWQLDFRQLNRGPGPVRLNALSGVHTNVLGLEFEGSAHQHTMPPVGSVSFGIPVRAHNCGTIGRRELFSESITAIGAESGMEVCSKQGFSVYTISIAESRLIELATQMDIADPDSVLSPHCLQRIFSSREIEPLRQMLAVYLQAANSAEPLGAAATTLSSEVERELPLKILSVWSLGREAPYVSPSNRTRVVRRALEYLHSNAHRPVTVEDLCRASAASISTLERAFKERFDLSPKRYLMALRLGSARRALIERDSSRYIADIAAEWGFWHMSKFAVDYQQMFGELPSQTSTGSY